MSMNILKYIIILLKMSKEILYGEIYISQVEAVDVCDNYSVQNVENQQVCFNGFITNKQTNNWSDGTHPKLKPFNCYYPIELFIGKKEGDVVELQIQGYKIMATCKQLPYTNQTFEQTLHKLTQSFGGVCTPGLFGVTLSKKEQRQMIIDAHVKYAQSVGLKCQDPKTFQFY